MKIKNKCNDTCLLADILEFHLERMDDFPDSRQVLANLLQLLAKKANLTTADLQECDVLEEDEVLDAGPLTEEKVVEDWQ